MESGTQNVADDFISEYEESTAKKTGLSSDERMKKNFTPREETEKIRIIKQLDVQKGTKTEVVRQEAHFHVLKIGKQWRKIYCPKENDGQECALCDKYTKMLGTQKRGKDLSDVDKSKNKVIFIDALKYQAKKFYILKVLDYGQLKDGVKFWRFKHNFKKEGVMDILINTIKRYKKQYGDEENPQKSDFTHPVYGCDLEINTTKKTLPGSSIEYTAVSAIFAEPQSQLNDNLTTYLTDKTTWRDIWKATVIGDHIDQNLYLKLCAEGNAPQYDVAEKRWSLPAYPNLEAKLNTRSQNVVEDDDDEDSLETKSEPIKNAVDFDKLSSELESKTETIEKVEEMEVKRSESAKKLASADFDVDDVDLDDLPF